MNFILYSNIGESAINSSLGLPEYSYYFVLQAFRSVLAELGSVTLVTDPATQVDQQFEACRQRGEECVFLSFSPPNKTLVDLKCPTVSVFAWEYSNIPNEQWDDDPRNDWRTVFASHGRTITLSGYTARAVKQAMGPDFPVLAVPAPLWEQFAGARARLKSKSFCFSTEIQLRGSVLDSKELGLCADRLIVAAPPVVPTPVPAPVPPLIEVPPVCAPPLPQKTVRFRLAVTKRYLLAWYREALRDLLPPWLARTAAIAARKSYAMLRSRLVSATEPVPQPLPQAVSEPAPEPAPEPAAPSIPGALATTIEEPEVQLKLSGVVYTSVFSPKDGRKNWFDMVTAFCWTFRDVDDATLVLKMNERDLDSYRPTLMTLLSQLAPFKCRVVTVHAFLDDATYEELIGATTYYVNTSVCEGLCLPLMEFMACGVPVIAPKHTAMEDYIDEDVAFIIKSGLEHNVWPNDPRDLFRTLRYRLDWVSICAAYRDSYQMAQTAPEQYRRMSDRVLGRLRSYASVGGVRQQLQDFFKQTEPAYV